MEHLAPSVNKAILFCFFAFSGCNSNDSILIVNESSKDLNLFKKNVEYLGKTFSGVVYSSNNFGDTISIGHYKKGLKHGIWKKFHSNGWLKERRLYRNGLKVGLHEGFYNDGSKNFVFLFKNGEYHGTNRLWAKNGQIIEELNFKKGQQTGSQKVWYLDGKIKSNYIIKNNRRYGLLGTKNCTNVSEKAFDM